MQRVAHVISTPAGVGGAERVVASLVRGAIERDWEPVVLNPFGRNGPDSDLAAICRPARFESLPCDSPQELIRLRRWLARRLSEIGPSIVHGHLFHAGVATATLRRHPRRRTLLTHHHGDHLVYLGRRGRARLDRWAGGRYDRVVAISEATRTFLLSRYGYDESRVALIRNGWEGQPRPHVEQDRPTVISVANFRRQKGHDELLRAFALVRERLPTARLVLVGEGELEQELRGLTSELGLVDSVDFRGAVVDVWPELARADVFALASLYEPMGIALIEAMTAGLPVVGASVGGIPELIDDGANGLLVTPDDPHGLAEALVRVLSAPDRGRSMGAAGAASASGLTAARMTERYFELYDELSTTAGWSPRG